MTYPDPANPHHWINNPDGTRTAKPPSSQFTDNSKSNINIINNNTTNNMGDNSIVNMGNGTIIPGPKPVEKSIYSVIKDNLINHITKYIVGAIFTIVTAAIAYWV